MHISDWSSDVCSSDLAGKIDALVTAPINKKNIQGEHFTFPGHTEYLQHKAGVSDVLMFMISDEIKVGVVTGHIPVSEIASTITKEKIVSKLTLMNESLSSETSRVEKECFSTLK